MSELKLLEENTNVNPHDHGLSTGFLDMTLKRQVKKEKLGKLNFIKIKTFCATENTTQKVKKKKGGGAKTE